MEQLKLIIVQYWPDICSYFLMAVSYFLVFLYRSKIKDAKNNLTVLFKETADAVTKENKRRQKEMWSAKEEYLKAKAEYEDAIARVSRLEDALKILLEPEVSADDSKEK